MYVNLVEVTKAKAKKLERKLAYNTECSSEKPLDEPIRTQFGDVFGHAPVAHEFAQSILELSTQAGDLLWASWGRGDTAKARLST